ncbi:MAG: hypothetical protein FWD35_00055 [Oscillospiraceae bacterium]|nr:hypothetical protein [Oscillospiraceae bacterium]
MTTTQKSRRLKTLVSFAVMFAMILSMVVELPTSAPAPIVSELAGASYASENPNDDDDDDGANVRRVQFNDASGNSIPAGFVSGPFSVTLGHRPREGQNVTIYYTTSQTSAEWSPNGFQFPYIESNDPVSMARQMRERHDGGVDPMGYDIAGRAERYNFTWHQGVQTAQPGATVQVSPNPGAGNYASVFTISAMAVIQTPHGHETSRVRTRSWILGPNRWQGTDFMVFSVYAGADELFGWNDGILIPGLDRGDMGRELVRLNPGRYRDLDAFNQQLNNLLLQGAYPPTWPANFTRRGRGAEVLGNVEMFDPNAPVGEQRLINQRVGIRMKGGWSRGTYSYEQRTFEFYARDELGDRNNFLFPLFEEEHMHDGNLMHRYRRFRVRNGGTDREQLYMRDELGSELAKQSGFENAQRYRPAVVFLNGGYYGMTFMKSPRTEDHWQRLYGGRRNGFHLSGSNENGADTCFSNYCGRVIPGSSGGTEISDLNRQIPRICGEGVERCSRAAGGNTRPCADFWSEPNSGCEIGRCRASSGRGSWREVRSVITGEGHNSGGVAVAPGTRREPNGLQNDANWARLNELVCLDNLFHYYALQIFGANVDWPSNNVEMWKYFTRCGNGSGGLASPPVDCENRQCTVEGCENLMVRRGELHPHLDGRWRFIAQDLEYGWGLFANGVEASATHHTSNTLHALIVRTGTRNHVPGEPPEHGEWEVENTPNPRIRHHFNASAQSFIMPAMLNPAHSTAARAQQNRERLANALADIIQGSHSAANMASVANRIWTMKENEHRHMIGHGNVRMVNDNYQVTTTQHSQGQRRISEFPRGNPWGEIPPTPYWAPTNRPWDPDTTVRIDPNSISTGARQMLTDFLQHRGTQMQNMMGRTAPSAVIAPPSNSRPNATPTGDFGLGLSWASGRDVQISVTAGGWAQINTRVIGMEGVATGDPRGAKSATVKHFGTAPVRVIANPWPGYRVASVSGGTPCPTGLPNYFITTGATSIAVSFERDTTARYPEITALQARAQGTQGNWIEITNNTASAITTRGLYMSDNWEDRNEESSSRPQDRDFDFRWRMPAFIIRPGETVFLRTTGTNLDSHRALKRAETNFGVAFGERLRLADSRGNVIQKVEVSLMTNGQMQRRGVGANGVDDGNWRIVDWNGQRGQGIR